jgi:Mg-chelatase subunit ChlD
MADDGTAGFLYLPECKEPWDIRFELTDEERAALYGDLMDRGGSKGFDDFFRRMARKRSTISDQIERLRTRLESQARKMRKRIDAKHGDDKRRLGEKYDPLVLKLRREEKERGRRGGDDALGRQLDSELAKRFMRDPVFDIILTADGEEPAPPPKPTAWQRFRAALGRAWRAIVNFFRRLFGRGKPKDDGRRGTPASRLRALFDFPSLRGLGKNLGERFEALTRASPDALKKVETELIKQRRSDSRSGTAGGRRSGEGGPVGGSAHDIDADLPSDPGRRTEVLLERYISDEVRKRRRRLQRVAKKEREAERRARARREELEKDKRQRDDELDRRLERERRELEEAVGERPGKMVRDRLLQELEESGLVRWDRGELVVTSSLVERFAEIVLSREMQKLPKKHRHRFGLAVTNRGVYEKGRLLDHHEISRMDIVDSYVRARMSHPGHRGITEDDVVTKRELRGAITHVVLMFDKSGSMEENGRIAAAKRAVLALFKAVKHQDNRNTVDLIAFDTRVRVMDLYEVWNTSPGGFTNTSAALDAAGDLLSRSRADRKVIYLITDGLPEAYTLKGEPRAGNPEKSLEAAMRSASALHGIEGLRLTIILLEPEKRMYIDATKSIAESAGGSIITTDPKNLAPELLIDYGL